MGKKTTLTTAVLFAMGTTGTCMASQLPSDSSMLNIPLPSTSEYESASNTINEGDIVIVAQAVKKKDVKIETETPGGVIVTVPKQAAERIPSPDDIPPVIKK